MILNGPIPKISTLLRRDARWRCPHCGEGDVYVGCLKLHERSPKCRFEYLVYEGDLWAYIGMIGRSVFLFPLVVLICVRFDNSETPWFYFLSGIIALCLVYTLPRRSAMEMVMDYWMRWKYGDLAPEDQPLSDAQKNP